MKQSPHGRTLNIKATLGITAAQVILHKRIILEELYGMYVDIHTAVGAYYLCTLLYVAYASLTEDVKLLITKLLGCVHVPLGGGKSLRRHVKGSITAQWLFRYEHTAGMDTAQVGKISYLIACLKDEILYFTSIAFGGGIGNQGINLINGQTVHLAQFADY